MTEVKHTPLPWLVDRNASYCAIRAKSGLSVGDTCASDPSTKDFPLGTANAAFIVRACNSHYELVEALSLWKEFWDDMPKGQLGKLTFDVGLLNDAFIAMSKALAKAKGAA